MRQTNVLIVIVSVLALAVIIGYGNLAGRKMAEAVDRMALDQTRQTALACSDAVSSQPKRTAAIDQADALCREALTEADLANASFAGKGVSGEVTEHVRLSRQHAVAAYNLITCGRTTCEDRKTVAQ